MKWPASPFNALERNDMKNIVRKPFLLSEDATGRIWKKATGRRYILAREPSVNDLRRFFELSLLHCSLKSGLKHAVVVHKENLVIL